MASDDKLKGRMIPASQHPDWAVREAENFGSVILAGFRDFAQGSVSAETLGPSWQKFFVERLRIIREELTSSAASAARAQAVEEAARLSVWPEDSADEAPWFGEHAEEGWENAVANYREAIRALAPTPPAAAQLPPEVEKLAAKGEAFVALIEHAIAVEAFTPGGSNEGWGKRLIQEWRALAPFRAKDDK